MARRREMVEAVRAGSSQRAVARQFGVSLATVQAAKLDEVMGAQQPRTEREVRDG